MDTKLYLIFTILFINSVISFELPNEDGFASRFVARIHRVGVDRGSLLTNGVFINSRSILTTASAIQNLTMAQIRIDYGNTRLDGRLSVVPESVVVHPNFNINNLRENNLAVLRLSQQNGNIVNPQVTGREIGPIVRSSHFCAMFGYAGIFSEEWQGLERMLMEPSIIQFNSTTCYHLFRGDFTCTFGRRGITEFCGGFMGSPIICDGVRVSGLVTQDNYCGNQPTAYVTDLNRHREWIRRASNISATVMTSIFLTFACFLISKIL